MAIYFQCEHCRTRIELTIGNFNGDRGSVIFDCPCCGAQMSKYTEEEPLGMVKGSLLLKFLRV